jgi:hypothetical protein
MRKVKSLIVIKQNGAFLGHSFYMINKISFVCFADERSYLYYFIRSIDAIFAFHISHIPNGVTYNHHNGLIFEFRDFGRIMATESMERRSKNLGSPTIARTFLPASQLPTSHLPESHLQF